MISDWRNLKRQILRFCPLIRSAISESIMNIRFLANYINLGRQSAWYCLFPTIRKTNIRILMSCGSSFYANSEKEYGRDSYIGNKNDRKAAIDSIKNIWECKCEMFGKDKVIFPLVESGNSGALTKMQSFEAIIDNYVLYGGPQNADHLVISIPFDDLVSEARGVNLIQCYNYIKSIHEILSFKSHINAGTYSSWLTLQWGQRQIIANLPYAALEWKRNSLSSAFMSIGRRAPITTAFPTQMAYRGISVPKIYTAE